MKIEFAESTGCPHGQFVVRAESAKERAVIRDFIEADHDDWKFWLHGWSYDIGKPEGPYSFNFGWTKNQEKQMEAQPNPTMMLVFQGKPKPKMLFLDDRTRRIQSALRQFSEKWDVTIVTNVKECLRYLSREDWDEVRLDHDLRGVDFEDPDSSEAGMEVVRYIEKTGWPGGKRKPIFRIHSSNLFAAHLMVMRLQALGLIAFYEQFVYDDQEPHMTYDKEGLPVK